MRSVVRTEGRRAVAMDGLLGVSMAGYSAARLDVR